MTDEKAVSTHSSDMTKRKALSNLAGQHFGGDRDLYEVMGYPRVLDFDHFLSAYDRQDIAGRIIDAYPDATWREPPEVVGSEAFVQEFSRLMDSLNFWRVFHRADRLMNLGHYGVIFLGLDGGEDPALPARQKDYNLLYAQPHSERTAEIIKWDSDPQSSRFGKPEMYRITSGVNWTGAGAGQRTLTVHHSRVIHLTERALEDEAIGTPRLKRIFNRLMDMDKLLGGSAEMYWQNVAMILQFNADAGTQWAEGEKEQLEEQLEEMQNRLRRSIRTRGIAASNLAPGLQGADPGSHLEKQIDIMAGATGIPKRILLGNEAGELASSQDETNWQGRIAERREQVATPSFIDQLVAKGRALGFLPEGYEKVVWPESDSLGEKGRAEVAAQVTTALMNYMNAIGGEEVLSRKEFRNILGLEEEIEAVRDPVEDVDDNLPFTSFRSRKPVPLRAVDDDRV